MQRLRTRRPSRSSQFQGMLMLGIVMAAMSGAAQIPGIISYQGKLANEGADLEGTYAFKFAFVGAAGDITYWSHDNTGANGTEPVGPAIQLPVIRGVFAVNLGDVTVSNMMVSIPASVFTNEEVFLRIWIDDGVNGFQRQNPDSRMGSVGYALAAAKLVGPIAETQLPSNVARLSAKQTFTGINTFAGPTRLTNRFNVLVGRHLGDGSGLTNIRASSIVGMSLLDGGGGSDNRRTPAFLEPDQVFTGSNSFTGVVRLTNPNNMLAGDGAGLTNLNAANIVGPLPDFALPQGLMIASIHPRDSRLLTNGFRRIASMRSPAWQDGQLRTEVRLL